MPLFGKKSSSAAVGHQAKREVGKSTDPVLLVTSPKQANGVKNDPEIRSPTQKMQREPQENQSRQQTPDVPYTLGKPSHQRTSAPLGELERSRSPSKRPPLQPQSQKIGVSPSTGAPDMDQLRLLAYQQRQKERRRDRVITPSMLKARPVEIKQNVVMRSKHNSSDGSVTSYRSDATEKVTNMKAYRRKPQDFDRLETLESKETFESLKNDAENKMAMANAMLDEAAEAKRKAEMEIAEEKERLKAAAEERRKTLQDQEEMQLAVLAQAAKERERYVALEQKLAAATEEKRQAQEEAQRKIAMLEANQRKLEQQHKAEVAGAQNQAKIVQMEEKLLIAALKEEEESQNLEAEEKHLAQEVAEERIKIMESEQKRLDLEHKVALAEAQAQAKNAAEEKQRFLEVQQQKQSLEEQLRLEIARHAEIAEATKRTFFEISAAEAQEKKKAQAEAAERIAVLESRQRLLDEEHKAALAEAQRLAKIAADEEKSRLQVDQQRLQLEEQLRIEIERHAKFAAEEEEWRRKAEETRMKLEDEAYRQAQIASDEGMKRLELESRRLELEAETQKQAQIAVDEGKKRLEAEQMRIALEARLLEVEKEKRAVEAESRKWYDLRNLGSWQHAADTTKSTKKKSETESYSGFFISKGVSNVTTEEDEEEGNATSSHVPKREAKNLDTIEDSWTKLGDKLATKMNNTSKRADAQHSAALQGLKLLVSETIRELAVDLAAEQGRDLFAVESEDLKLLDQECRKAEERFEETLSEYRQASEVEEEHQPKHKIKAKKTSHKDKAKEAIDASRLGQLKLELAELSQVIAEKKEEAARLLSDRAYNDAIQRGAGKASKEKDSLEYRSEEGIEVMPTLSDTEIVSVNEPLSVDESAFAQNSTLSIKTEPHIKVKDDVHGARNESNQAIVTSTSRASRISRTSRNRYDPDPALATTSKESLAYEDDVNELIPDTFEIPERRVRSKEAAIQSDGYQRASPQMEHPVMSPRMEHPVMSPRMEHPVMSPRMKHPVMSPRVNSSRPIPPSQKKESFWERTFNFADKACTGTRRATVGACVDSCESKQFNENGALEQERADLEMEMKYYELRNEEGEHPVTGVFVNTTPRVEGEHHGEFRQHSARRKAKKQVRYNDIMSVDGRYVKASKHARARRDREQVPRNLEITPRARTPRGGRQQAWGEEVTSPRGDKYGEDVGSVCVIHPRENLGEEVSRPREESPKPKKGKLGSKMLKGMKKLTKARIVYDD